MGELSPQLTTSCIYEHVILDQGHEGLMKQQLGGHASHGLPKRAFKPDANLNATDTAALLWVVTTWW